MEASRRSRRSRSRSAGRSSWRHDYSKVLDSLLGPRGKRRRGASPLLQAVLYSSHSADGPDGKGFRCVKQLLEQSASADICKADESGWTPIFHAVRLGMDEILQLLLDALPTGPESSEGSRSFALAQVDAERCTAVFHAKTVGCAQLLLQHRSDVNHRDSLGQAALAHAVRRARASAEGADLVAELLSCKAEAGATDLLGRTALFAAAGAALESRMHEETEQLQQLTDALKSAAVTFADPLCQSVKLLLEARCCASCKDLRQFTAAQYFESLVLSKEISLDDDSDASGGSDPTFQGNPNQKLVMELIEEIREIENESHVKALDRWMSSQLHRLQTAFHPSQIAQAFYEAMFCEGPFAKDIFEIIRHRWLQPSASFYDAHVRKSLTFRDPLTGETCLNLAATFGQVDVVELLLALQCDPRKVTVAGDNCLHSAALKGQKQCCEMILKAEAAMQEQGTLQKDWRSCLSTQRNVFGDTPLMLASKKFPKDLQLRKLLKQHSRLACWPSYQSSANQLQRNVITALDCTLRASHDEPGASHDEPAASQLASRAPQVMPDAQEVQALPETAESDAGVDVPSESSKRTYYICVGPDPVTKLPIKTKARYLEILRLSADKCPLLKRKMREQHPELLELG